MFKFLRKGIAYFCVGLGSILIATAIKIDESALYELALRFAKKEGMDIKMFKFMPSPPKREEKQDYIT